MRQALIARSSLLLVLACVGIAVGAWFVLGRGSGEGSAASPSSRDAVRASSSVRPALAVKRAIKEGTFDCTRPAGDAARVDAVAITVDDLCGRLRRLGAYTKGADRQLAQHVLDRMIDATIVRRALDRAGVAITDADLTAAFGAMAPSIGADVDLLTQQLRERLELKKLVERRGVELAVTNQDVDAELASGAPGIDRGQGISVEGWIARIAPTADAASQTASQHRADAFAAAIKTTSPDVAAARHEMQPLAPFVIGESGIEPELETAAYSLPKGRWSAPLRTRVGWVVVQVVGAEQGLKLDTPALRARVRKALETRKLQAAQQRVLEELRAAARIEYLVDL